ncbi:MAG TPA: DUF4160 domain-containing protein [Solirubrobacteraceae bacterium]|nr:DUF4160 domain-containing protein [Solirubrobacteraceae bacterium]
MPLLRDRDREVLRRSRPCALHARHADGQAKVRIDRVEVIESNLDVRQLRLVLAWAELHREELLENWGSGG